MSSSVPTVPVFDKSDPKNNTLYPFHVPLTDEWSEDKGIFGQSMLMGSGAGIFLKNPLIVYASLIIAVISVVNYSPLRAPKDSQSPLMSLGLGLMGLFTINMPKMMIPANPAPPADAAFQPTP